MGESTVDSMFWPGTSAPSTAAPGGADPAAAAEHARRASSFGAAAAAYAAHRPDYPAAAIAWALGPVAAILLVVVGALHLVGEGGLLEALRKDGHTPRQLD
jgi:hypothetical protein